MGAAALAALALLAVLASDLPAGPVLPPGAGGVLVAPGEAARPLEAGQPVSLTEGEAVWWWSKDCAPRRETLPLPTRLPCEPARPVAGRFGVAGRTAEGTRKASFRAIWGTAEMLKEIPDSLLPEGQVDADGRVVLAAPRRGSVLVRAAGPSVASQWLELRADQSKAAAAMSAALALPATAISTRVQSADGSPAEPVFLEIALGNHMHRAHARDGRIEVPPLPSGEVIDYLLWDRTSAPLTGRCKVSEFPETLQLRAGVQITARCVRKRGEEDVPVVGALVEAVFVLPGTHRGLRRTAESGTTGRVALKGLTAGVQADVVMSYPGLAPVRRRLRLEEGAVDLGRILFEEGRTAVVRVKSAQDGKPIAGATLEIAGLAQPSGPGNAAGAPLRRRADEKGIVTVENVSGDASPNAWIIAKGFQGTWVPLSGRGDDPIEVSLERASRLTARVVFDGTGEPAGPGRVILEWETGATYSLDFPMPGQMGRLELSDLTPGRLTLEVRADGANPIRLPPVTLVPGSDTSLGEIRLPRGLSISGRLESEVTGRALAGANVRTLRPSPFGQRLSAVRGDFAEAVSDAEGRFRISGLGPGSYAVLIQAPGHGTMLKTGLVVAEEQPDGGLDLGSIVVPEPREVQVACRPERRCGRQAQILLGGPSNDWAALSAPLQGGTGRLFQVPAGTLPLRLMERGSVLFDREIDVDRREPVTTVEISLPSVIVEGEVTLGGRPSSGGTVLLKALGAEDHSPSIFLTARTDSGAEAETEVIGALPRASSGRVDDGGRFSIADVSPGPYDVSYVGASGAIGRPRRVEVPEAPRFSLRLDLPAAELEGTVVDERGDPPRWASVTARSESGETHSANADSSGRFRFAGLASGVVSVKARNDEAEAAEDAEIREGRVNEIRLVLRPKRSPRLLVRTFGPAGERLAGTLVFLLEEGSGPRPSSTDVEGVSRYKLQQPGLNLRLAAFHPTHGWAFAETPRKAEADTEVDLRMSRMTGELEITTESPRTSVLVVTPQGLPLSTLLTLLGLPVQAEPGAPLRIRGLPPNAYQISAPGRAPRVESITGGDLKRLRL